MHPRNRKFLVLGATLALWTSASHGEYALSSPPPAWQKILEAKHSFDGTASLRDFLQFVFQRSDANYALHTRTKSEFQITAAFRDRTLKDILATISQRPWVRVSWGYEQGSSDPQRIEITTGPIDLMSRELDLSHYPETITLQFSPLGEQIPTPAIPAAP